MLKEENHLQEESSDSIRIKLVNICKSYEGKSHDKTLNQLVALKDISFEVKQNDFVVIVGPSGSGKSTLLSMIAGLSEPSSGSILLDDKEVTSPNPKKLSLMFQDSLLLPWRTVESNIMLPFEKSGTEVQASERKERAKKYLDLVGLGGYESFYPKQLSGGMKQRVALCRALVMETDILLMDEPFGALDEQTRLILSDELVNIWQRVRKTIVFVTHSLSEAIYLGNRIIVLSSRPGQVKDIIEVNLSRPRRFNTKEFGELSQRLWDELRREILRT